MLSNVWATFRYALRTFGSTQLQLRNRPSLGIGINTAVFSSQLSIAWRSLPYEPDAVTALRFRWGGQSQWRVSIPEYAPCTKAHALESAYSRRGRRRSGLAGHRRHPRDMQLRYQVLGVSPVVGTGFACQLVKSTRTSSC